MRPVYIAPPPLALPIRHCAKFVSRYLAPSVVRPGWLRGPQGPPTASSRPQKERDTTARGLTACDGLTSTHPSAAAASPRCNKAPSHQKSGWEGTCVGRLQPACPHRAQRGGPFESRLSELRPFTGWGAITNPVIQGKVLSSRQPTASAAILFAQSCLLIECRAVNKGRVARIT
ncbi:hypothetical protein BU16DRAFT_234556 [Lophium mytilinum]|uniref:Uncharacterized protein n=1 Tax=Lophium mytilinum TaxID=390894 RepID=A0A6A6R620_9PEZI|nr:hypothetical protein BU16DRAFT_234556 [Lophium mytilinum]